jgi:hypothetical protein
LALKNLESEKIPLQRPGDYLVQMYKGDDIMKKVKGRLIEQDVIKKKDKKNIFTQKNRISEKKDFLKKE